MEKEIFTQKVLEANLTMYRIAKSMMINETDCEDVVQNAILKSYQKLDTLKQEEFFKTWLIRILINECYKFKRSDKQDMSYEEYLDSEPIHMTSEKADYQEIYTAIKGLKPAIRIVICLYYLEEYSVQEIKEILKIPSGTVKSRLSKGRKELKLALEQQQEDRV